MKTIVEINSMTGGSTGKIMFGIAEKARRSGMRVYTASAYNRNEIKVERDDHIYIGNVIEKNIHLRLAKYLGLNGCFSQVGTWLFCRKLDSIKPDVIHLHNLHNCYINVPMLFGYIKKRNIPVIWTLHDCWAFTGHCPYFDMANCDKWKSGCDACPQFREYPYSNIDSSKRMYQLKKKWFTGVDNLTIATPSQWLADLVKQSFLKDYPVKVIHNGINTDIFKPTPSDIRECIGIRGGVILLLGVASDWSKRKGLQDFINLAKMLDSNYKILLVGIPENMRDSLPEKIIAMGKTHTQEELAELYSAADVFVNPTKEEVLGMVNLEALACGTPVVTYSTGGCMECVDESCGRIVEKSNIDMLFKAIKYVVAYRNELSPEHCVSFASAFEQGSAFERYVDIY